MDKKQFGKRVNQMLPDLTEAIRKESDRLYDCGGIDTGYYGDDCQLPRIILTAAIENQIHQFRPTAGKSIKAVRNLRHF